MKRQGRFYRDFTDTCRWTSFRVKVETSDLYIRAGRDLSEIALAEVRRLRDELWRHIDQVPDFMTSYGPLPFRKGPEVAAMMYRASERAGVGPMAAVAGAIAELTGRALLCENDEIIVENGGDIWMNLTEPATATVYAGEFRFPGALKIRINPQDTPCGICTSSAKIGPSFSYGKADSVTVIAGDAALADALATDCCNRIKSENDIEEAIDIVLEKGASGVLAVYYDTLGIKGNIELTG